MRYFRQVGITIKGRFLAAFFRLDKLNDLVGQNIVKNPTRVPRYQPQFRVISSVRKRLKECEQRGAHLSAGCAITPGLPAIARKRTLRTNRAESLFSRTSFINVKRAAIQFVAVGGAHRGITLRRITHGDERKSARFTRHLVHHQIDFFDGAVLFE